MIIQDDRWFHIMFAINTYYFNLDHAKNHMCAIKENYWFQETNKESDIAASEYFLIKI